MRPPPSLAKTLPTLAPVMSENLCATHPMYFINLLTEVRANQASLSEAMIITKLASLKSLSTKVTLPPFMV